MKQPPKVSVCMITYGHEQFIEQAINGVLMQQGEFEIELIIANDCSPDSTNQIILHVISTHSKGKLIKYYKHDENIGMMPNFIFTLKHCAGKYIALCEGDDYWTDPLKLQKQVAFLEANEDYAICFHSVVIENKILEIEQYSAHNLKVDSTIYDLAEKNYIPTTSAIFRSVEIDVFSSWVKNCLIGDYPLFLYLAQFGKIHFINEHMAVYRVHATGAWNGIPYTVSLLNLVRTIDILIEEIPSIRNFLIVHQYEILKNLANSDTDILSYIHKSLVDTIYKFERLKEEKDELYRRYLLLNNSRPVKFINAVKKLL